MMFQKLVTFFVLGFTCITLNTAAQPDDINFTSITTREGLSSNTVNTILKDRLGLVWFGTEDGLNCFDGVWLGGGVGVKTRENGIYQPGGLGTACNCGKKQDQRKNG